MISHLFRNTYGGTLIEIITILVILAIGIISSLSIIGSGKNLAKHTENTIQAINIARDGIEGVILIRNTNWVKFSSDRTNCWNAKGYDPAVSIGCIGEPSMDHDSKIGTGSYIIYNSSGLWSLSGTSNSALPEITYNTDSGWSDYYTKYKVYNDVFGYATQTGTYATICGGETNTGCVSHFAREIHISYTNTGSMDVSSIVRWVDSAYSGSAYNKKVILSTTLTNWKSNF